MEGVTALPNQVWEFILTWIPRICTVTGAIVIVYWWRKGALPAIFGATRHSQPDQRQGRRLDDKMIERMLTSQDRMAESFNNLADSIREQGKGFFQELQAQSGVMATGFRALHERFDAHIGDKAHKKVA